MGWEGLILLLLIGAAGLVLARVSDRRLGIAALVGLGFWLGTLCVSLLMVAAALVSGRFFFQIFWILIGAAAVILVMNRHELAGWIIAGSLTRPATIVPGHLFSSRRWWRTLLILPLLFCILLAVWLTASIATRYPIISIDAVGHFEMKARLWYSTGRLFPPQLLDPEYLMFKRTYPPVVPLMETLWATLYGWREISMKWFFLGCWAATGLLIFAILRRRGNHLAAWTGTALWFLLPYNMANFHGGAISGYADVPFAMALVAAALAMTELHSSTRPTHVILMALLLGGTFWIKREGIIFMGPAFVYLLVTRTPWRTLLATAAIVALMYILHLLSVRGIPSHLEKDIGLNITLAELMARLKSFPALALEEFDATDRWGHRLWYLFAAAWLVKLIRLALPGQARLPLKRFANPETFFFLSLFVIYILFLLVTIWKFPHNTRLGFHRLFIHLYPLMIIASFDALEHNLTPPTLPRV